VSFLRGVFLLPQIISVVVIAVLWMFVYQPNSGLLDGVLDVTHLQRLSRPWLGDSSTALWAVVTVFVWQGLGFYVMLLSAGIRGIPLEVSEAAKLDGADGFRRFRKVTLPMLWSITRVAVVYLVINSLNVFALVRLMTQGGPDRHTETMLTYLYEVGFKNSEFGLATALAVANFAIVMGVSLLVLAVFRRDPQEARSAA
jgi:N-acetylglucosamine transport system permease protein